MNNTQTIFTVFFAIVWGTSANAWPRRKPFNWPLIDDRRVLSRVALSVAMLNVIPVFFFAWALRRMDGVSPPHLEYTEILAGIVPAFFVFGIYRVWLAIIELKPSRFYHDSGSIESDEQTVGTLHPNPRPTPNLLFGLMYLFIAVTAVLLRDQLCLYLGLGVLYALIAYGLLWLAKAIGMDRLCDHWWSNLLFGLLCVAVALGLKWVATPLLLRFC